MGKFWPNLKIAFDERGNIQPSTGDRNREPSKFRICNSCELQKPSSDFPKKGKERHEASCKSCYNKKQKNKRAKSSPPKKSLDIVCEIGTKPCENWTTNLIQITKLHKSLDSDECSEGLEKVFTRNNQIWSLLEKDGT